VEPLFQVVLQAPAVERRVVGVDHAAAARVEGARHADADFARRARLLLGFGNETGKLLERRVIPGARRRRAPAQKLAAVLVEHCELDLRPAEVNP
jgi:hypothetical protein